MGPVKLGRDKPTTARVRAPALTGQPSIFILGGSSDIGRQLAARYVRDGRSVVATYRNARFGESADDSRMSWLACDVTRAEDIRAVARVMEERGLVWDTFISAIGSE